MEYLCCCSRLLVLFVIVVVSCDIIIINDDDDDDDDTRLVVRRSVVSGGVNGTTGRNCSMGELRRLKEEHERLRKSAGKLRNCSETIDQERLSVASITGLCLAQCMANCADLDVDCKDPNCTLYQTDTWALQCENGDYECLERCAENGTQSTEESQPIVPKRPTSVSIDQFSSTVVRITWSPPEEQSSEKTIIYVTESMSLSRDWTVIHQSTENWTEAEVGVCSVVTFRVAAVNQFGSDGYSLPSVRTEFPVPDMIIDANNESLILEDENHFLYQFMFYTPENWDSFTLDYDYPRKSCPFLNPPLPVNVGFKKIADRTYIHSTRIDTYGFGCIYTLQIYLKSSPCGEEGLKYTTYINLTNCEEIKGKHCPGSGNGMEFPPTTTKPLFTTTTDSSSTSNSAGEMKHSTSVALYVSVGVTCSVVFFVLLLIAGCIIYRKFYHINHLTTIQLQKPLHELNIDNILYISPENYTEIIGSNEWEILRTRLVLGEVLGQGAFGQVIKAVLQTDDDFLRSRQYLMENMDHHQTNQMTVAVKMLIGDHADLYRSDFLREMELMRAIGYHSNVVSMIGCCTKDDPLSLIVEHVALGDLLNFLQSYRARYQQQIHDEVNFDFLTNWDLMNFAQQIAQGMEFLSKKGFVHRDLAARNILVGKEKSLKIGDFGLTRYIYDDQVYVTNRGGKLPLKWMAIESIFDLTFTTASDVWSYGIVLYELTTLGGTPYPTISHKDLLRELQKGYRLERPAVNCSPELYRLMRDCWRTRPANRPNFTQLRKRLEAMTESIQDSPEAAAKALPIDESLYERRSEQSNNSSSSGCEVDISRHRRLDSEPETLFDGSEKLSELSNFDSGIVYLTTVDFDNPINEEEEESEEFNTNEINGPETKGADPIH